MEEKAQGALEYLLIIGAAIIVVAVAVYAVMSVASGSNTYMDDANAAIARDLKDLNSLIEN